MGQEMGFSASNVSKAPVSFGSFRIKVTAQGEEVWAFHYTRSCERNLAVRMFLKQNPTASFYSGAAKSLAQQGSKQANVSVSVHHQESSTVHTAIHTGYVDC